jgi:predicted  nucleic acid-binding Zn-ribbon protein
MDEVKLKKKISDLEYDISELEYEISELEDELSDCENNYSELEQENNELKRRYRDNSVYGEIKEKFLREISEKFSLEELEEIFQFEPGKGIQLKLKK